MPKSREKFRQATIRSKKEEPLDSKNMFGVGDPTPKEAVKRMREGK